VRIVDSHAHLDMLSDLDGSLARAREAGVVSIVTIGVDAASNEWAVSTASTFPDVWATVGLHPHDAKARTGELMARLASLAEEPHVVGVGEAGLDYHYDNSPRDVQREVFREQIALAKRVSKALVIHTRDAWDDTFAILEGEGPPSRLVFHCWSGGPSEVPRALDLGAVLSFSGTVTFKNALELREAAKLTPLDRLVVETDSPFLTPVPLRGKRNEPAFVVHTLAQVAAVKGVSLEEAAAATTATAARLFAWGSDAVS
jgi:TatD DNase family protein